VKLNQDYGAFPPEVSTDGKGHVYVVWSDERTEAAGDRQPGKSSGHRIYFNRSDDHGGTWLPQDIKLSGDAAGPGRMMQAWPQIRSDDWGHVYAIWFDTRGGGGGLLPGLGRFRLTWREDIRVKGTEGMSKAPTMAADDQGTSISSGPITAMGSIASTWWLRPTTVDVVERGATRCRQDEGLRASLPTLAADPGGHVYVAWQMPGTVVGHLPQHVLRLRKTWRTEGSGLILAPQVRPRLGCRRSPLTAKGASRSPGRKIVEPASKRIYLQLVGRLRKTWSTRISVQTTRNLAGWLLAQLAMLRWRRCHCRATRQDRKDIA
jgi:hypothetical protein